MKTILISIFILTLVSCGSKKIEQTFVEIPSTTIVEEDEIDAISSATRANNQPIFNGVIVIPPQRHATITLFMDGVVKSTSLLSGMYVRRGDLLAVLENPEYIALQQTYVESSAQEDFLEAEYSRQEMLFGNEAASQKTYQQSKAEYLSMKSRREAAEAQLSLLGFDAAKILVDGIVPHLELRSPIDGYVANVNVNIGAYISAGDPICEVIDKNTSLLQLTLYEKDIDKIKAGDKMQFRVNGLGTQMFNATVISLGQNVDIVSRSLQVYSRVDESDERFRPGMYVSAQVME